MCMDICPGRCLMQDSNNNQTIIIKNQEDEKRHFTWGDYIKQLNHFKYWILGITLLCVIAGYLFVAFYFSPKRETYVADVTLHMPLLVTKDDEGVTQSITYLNGSAYSMYDIINVNNITKTVEETLDENGERKYSSLDATSIIEDNAITIALQASQTDSTVVSDPANCSYRLTLLASSFPNINIARSFVNDLLENTIESAISLVPSNHISNIISNVDCLTSTNLNNEVDTLAEQYNLISDCYDELMSSFQGAQYILDGKDLTTIYNEFINTFQSESGYESIFEDLELQLDSNAYFRYENTEEGINDAITQCHTLANQYANKLTSDYRMLQFYENRRDSITGLIKPSTDDKETSSTEESLLEMILECNQKILDLQLEMNDLRTSIKALGFDIVESETNNNYIATAEPYEITSAIKMLEAGDTPGTLQYLNDELSYLKQDGTVLEKPDWGDDCQEFITKVNDYIPLLSSALTTANTIYHNLYKNNLNSIVYNNSSILVSNGRISGAWGAILGLVFGFLASSLIFAGVGYSKDKKKEELAAAVESDKLNQTLTIQEAEQTDSSTDANDLSVSSEDHHEKGSEDEQSK